ncbi:hypothetical protein [Dyadobacter sp. CY356]|uniref:hypothetical protein n=1 Tax=Dyadobacter sp. CY356 TaxID=2906442 RepID=UPI001F37E36E|nr:hypothetical protein [Dyadobacter sp. CY356]MCF0056038.1 hypothetical protein [Dyadobacter sp. CY356]
MFVIHSKSGKEIKATVRKLDTKEILSINKDKFHFNWRTEISYNVYMLTADGIEGALGLISIEDRSMDYAIQIRLLACAKENMGSGKKYDRIAGCLIAFACMEAFKSGYGGYICLKPKTILKEHYQEMYGFTSTKLFLVSQGQNSLALINKYYEK